MFVFRELRAGKTSFVSSGVVVNQKEQLGFHRALRYVILTPAIELEEKYEGETNEKRHYKQGANYDTRSGTRIHAAFWLAPVGNRLRPVHANGGARGSTTHRRTCRVCERDLGIGGRGSKRVWQCLYGEAGKRQMEISKGERNIAVTVRRVKPAGSRECKILTSKE